MSAPLLADHNDPTGDLRRAGTRIRHLVVDDRVGFPDLNAGGRVECMESAIDGRDIHSAFPHRNAAIDEITTGMPGSEMGRLGVITPDLLSCRGINSVHVTHVPDVYITAVDNDWRRLLAAIGAEVVCPGKPSLPTFLLLIRVRGE